ncbi:hypothetical protein [Methanococcoides sp. FTZ1]|uniref:hypothetical protein n=1 Tax=Methanococcoides sp. FTZ1 TaxID=3439061 RepID=UPI003F86D48E
MSFYEDSISELINEFRTRKEIIDPLLKKQNWYPKYIKEEVNTVKSDFVNKNFVYFNGIGGRDVDRFADYVLLDENENAIAAIEAKKYTSDPSKWTIQARTYAKDIEAQVKRKIPIFLTNGDKWFFIDETRVERKVSGPFSQEDLHRRNDGFHSRKNPAKTAIKSSIVDRPRSVHIVEKLSEHFSDSHKTTIEEVNHSSSSNRIFTSQ